MGLPKSGDAASRFSAYVEGLASVIGHADRAKPLRDYCVGLMMPCERKSVEPMAAITAPERTAAQHQSLLHFVGEGNWSDEKVLLVHEQPFDLDKGFLLDALLVPFEGDMFLQHA